MRIILGILLLIFLIPPARAGQVKTVVLLETMPVPVVLEHSRWFLDEMENLGWIRGQTMTLIRFNMDGDLEKGRAFLGSVLSETTPDLVVTNATLATLAAMPFLEKRKIPQLFFTVADPVGCGIIKEKNAPTGNHLTGRIYSMDQRARIRNVFRLVGQLPLKRPIRFGIIHSSYPSAVSEVKSLQKAAEKGIVFLPHEIQYRKVPDGIPAMLAQVRAAIKTLEARVDFWWEVAGPLAELHEYGRIFRDTSSHPVVLSNTLEGVQKVGALLYMNPDNEKYGREVAPLAQAILTGTDPGAMPVTETQTFLMALNLRTALAMGIVVPSDMFELAGSHIYR